MSTQQAQCRHGLVCACTLFACWHGLVCFSRRRCVTAGLVYGQGRCASLVRCTCGRPTSSQHATALSVLPALARGLTYFYVGSNTNHSIRPNHGVCSDGVCGSAHTPFCKTLFNDLGGYRPSPGCSIAGFECVRACEDSSRTRCYIASDWGSTSNSNNAGCNSVQGLFDAFKTYNNFKTSSYGILSHSFPAGYTTCAIAPTGTPCTASSKPGLCTARQPLCHPLQLRVLEMRGRGTIAGPTSVVAPTLAPSCQSEHACAKLNCCVGLCFRSVAAARRVPTVTAGSLSQRRPPVPGRHQRRRRWP